MRKQQDALQREVGAAGNARRKRTSGSNELNTMSSSGCCS